MFIMKKKNIEHVMEVLNMYTFECKRVSIQFSIEKKLKLNVQQKKKIDISYYQ